MCGLLLYSYGIDTAACCTYSPFRIERITRIANVNRCIGVINKKMDRRDAVRISEPFSSLRKNVWSRFTFRRIFIWEIDIHNTNRFSFYHYKSIKKEWKIPIKHNIMHFLYIGTPHRKIYRMVTIFYFLKKTTVAEKNLISPEKGVVM